MLWSLLVGQAPPEVAWLGPMVNLGSFAVIVFLVVYQAPKMAQRFFDYQDQANTRQDQMMAAFQNQADRLVVAFQAAIERLQTTFRSEVEAVRERSDRRADTIAQSVQNLQSAILDGQHRQYEEMGEMVKAMTELRRTVEDAIRALYKLPAVPREDGK